MKPVAFSVLLIFVTVPVFSEEQVGPSFGEHQLARLLDDRPSMKGVLSKDDVIYRWVVRKFDTGAFGHSVKWDSQMPLSGFDAEHTVIPTVIRISDAQDVSGRDKWCLLVFELENLQNARYLPGIQTAVANGDMTRDLYATNIMILEFQALIRTQRFFRRYPIPGAKAESDPIYTGILGMKNDVDGFLAGYESGHPYREHYLNHFDYMRRLDEAPNYPIATTLAASVFSFFTNPGENKGTHLNTER